MAQPKDILSHLLNSYLVGLSGKPPEGPPEPFYGVEIEALYDPEQDRLLLVTTHMRFDYPATPEGLLEAKAVVDQLADLCRGSVEKLGDHLAYDAERGYVPAGERS